MAALRSDGRDTPIPTLVSPFSEPRHTRLCDLALQTLWRPGTKTAREIDTRTLSLFSVPQRKNVDATETTATYA